MKSAYDLVDRPTLLAKLKTMRFPNQFLRFLTDYYEGDNIVSGSAGKKTERQYQQRGLRQGCNLSSILFILYLTGLSTKLKEAEIGTKLGNILINHLFFADDIFISANSKEDLERLKRILEQWCSDHKMKVSADKTQIISPDNSEIWTITNLEDNETFVLQHVDNYPYLGINQFRSLLITTNERAKLVVKKLTGFRKLINFQKFYVADSVESYLAVWKNILLPTVMYGMDVIPISVSQLEKMELEQRKMGKVLLGVPESTANVAVGTLLGLKPIKMQIAKLRLKLYLKAKNSKEGYLLGEALKYYVENPSSLYISRMKQLLLDLKIEKSLEEMKLLDIDEKCMAEMRSSLIDMKTMSLVYIPRYWRKKCFVKDTKWSRAFVQFAVQNAGLGNRSDKLSKFALDEDGGRILRCPLCLSGNNNEIHLVVECSNLKIERKRIKSMEKISLEEWILERRKKPAWKS